MPSISLVVEDQEQVRALVVRVLALQGMQSLEASCEPKGWELFLQHADEIAFVYLDYSLEQGNGYSLYKKIREVKPDLKIVLSSAYPDIELQELQADPQAFFLMKPFRITALGEIVQKKSEKRFVELSN